MTGLGEDADESVEDDESGNEDSVAVAVDTWAVVAVLSSDC